MFVTVDLFEGKNVGAVVRNLHSLGRVAQQGGLSGPMLGGKLGPDAQRRASGRAAKAAAAIKAAKAQAQVVEGKGAEEGVRLAAPLAAAAPERLSERAGVTAAAPMVRSSSNGHEARGAAAAEAAAVIQEKIQPYPYPYPYP